MLLVLGTERLVTEELFRKDFNEPSDWFPILRGEVCTEGAEQSATIIEKAGMMSGWSFICLKHDFTSLACITISLLG